MYAGSLKANADGGSGYAGQYGTESKKEDYNLFNLDQIKILLTC